MPKFKLVYKYRTPVIKEIETDREFPFPHLSRMEVNNLITLLEMCCK